MKPVTFPGVNVVYAEHQPEYIPLPAIRFPKGETIQCWEFTPEEVEEINRTGRVFVGQWTFGQSLQPINVTADKSTLYPDEYEEFNPGDLKLNDRLLLYDPFSKMFFACTIIASEEKYVQVSIADYGVWNLVRNAEELEVIRFKVVAKIKS